MTDTAPGGIQFDSPALDLDAMLEDLHSDFKGDPPSGEEDGSDGSDTGADVTDTAAQGDEGAPPETPSAGDGELDGMLPPGLIQVGDELLPVEEVRALLELNRRVKTDPDTATRVRAAVLNERPAPTGQAPEADPDALPAWLDPEDQQAVYLYRHSQRVEAEVQEMRRNDAARTQQAAQLRESSRVTEVRDAFRTSMKEFRDEHPDFGLEDLNAIANKAANMGLLEHPEKVGGTLKGGIVTALETAMWATPQFREKAVAGATVRSQQEKSQSRKQKSSALSSSTGSVVRTQSQEQTPSNRKEVMAGALDFLRSGAVTE